MCMSPLCILIKYIPVVSTCIYADPYSFTNNIVHLLFYQRCTALNRSIVTDIPLKYCPSVLIAAFVLLVYFQYTMLSHSFTVYYTIQYTILYYL
jgi:hypothetical protein